MQPIASQKMCETCGASLDLEAPSDFCPGCLLATALETDASDLPSTGAHFGDFEIMEEIARGGMGVVYRARQRVPTRIVALKMILPAHIDSSEAIARFRAEAEAAASLDHEHILPIYGVGEKDGAPFYSMKLAEGGNLTGRLRDYAETPRKSAALVAALARAVENAHQHGILHRDLKPGNVLFDAAGKPFVSDFGLAKWLERQADLTQTLAILGTPYYMAPEQAAGSHSLAAATDVYSLGAILFHLLTGRVPFRGDNALDVLRQAAERPAPRPRALNRKIPPDLETICLKCLEKNPGARYPAAAALAEDLERFLAGRTILARPAGPVTHVRRWIGRNRIVAGLGVAAAALFLALMFALGRKEESSTTPNGPSKSGPADFAKSIAILPFENLSEDKSTDYFARGIHDDLLANLSRIGQLKVIARNSVLPYKADRNIRAIGRALGVRTVLEGNVRRSGNRTHIDVQLIDTANDSQIWAESFDRETNDILFVQSDLAARIAAALQVKLSPAERASIEKPVTRDPEAYDFYLRGRELLNGIASLGQREENLSTAIALLDRAVAHDPAFALGYSLLAELHLARFRVSGRDPARLGPVRANIETALGIAPNLGEAHLVRGMYFYYGIADYPSASSEFAAARHALPNNAECFRLSGLLERRLGHWNNGLQYQIKGVSLDPQNGTGWGDLAATYSLTRNFARADQILDQAITTIPEHANYFRIRKAQDAIRQGDLERCRLALESLPPDYEYDGLVHFFRACLAFNQRDFALADKILAEALQKLGAKNAEWWVARDQAFVARAEGDPVKTAAALQRALRVQLAIREKRPEDAAVVSLIALFKAGLGEKEEALEEIEKALPTRARKDDAVDGAALAPIRAMVYAWCGEREQALEQLAALATIPSALYPGDLKFNPEWDVLRADPRFQAVIAAATQPIKIE